MNICDQCGTPNAELETQCRICGHALVSDPEQGSGPVGAPISRVQPATPDAALTQEPPHEGRRDESPPQLQVSSLRRPAPTSAPPMLRNSGGLEAPPPERAREAALPNFMQEGARAHIAAQEPVSLISANDLPDWIRQIAEADAAQAEADASQLAAATEAPTPTPKPALPGETRASRPATNWLSKSASSQASSEHGGSEEAAAANWATPDLPTGWSAQPSYPTISAPAAYVSSVQGEPQATERRRTLGRPRGTASSDTPIYRNRAVQLAALCALVAMLAILIL